MNIEIEQIVGPSTRADGLTDGPVRLSRQGGQVVTDAHGKFFEASMRKQLYLAHAIVTAPVVYTTAAGTGGPLLWNPSTSGVNCFPVAVGWGVTVVSTVAAVLGLTGNTGQTSAPTTTTAIDSQTSSYLGGPAGQVRAYRIGTPTNAGNFLLPLGDLHTGALTTDPGNMHWVEVAGGLCVPPGGWCALAASATASTTVLQAAILYEEVPV